MRAPRLGAPSSTISSSADCVAEFLIVDGAPGSTRRSPPCGRCAGSALHGPQARNLFAHAPEHLHDEITADYNDMIYAATRQEIEARRKAFIRK